MADNNSGNLKSFYLVLGAVGVIAAGAVGWSFLSGTLSAAATELIPEIVSGEIEDINALIELATGVERGDPDAPITIMEFGDYQCPACQQFATMTKPQVDVAYVQGGTARFVFHDFPLSGHPHSFLAARAARCALDQGDDYYWPYHDQLFGHQSTWSASQSAPLRAFESYAGAIGLDVDDFAGCLNSDRHADVVSANMRLGMELGVTGTPTIFISKGNGMATRVNRWGELAGFSSIIDRLMEDSGEGN